MQIKNKLEFREIASAISLRCVSPKAYQYQTVIHYHIRNLANQFWRLLGYSKASSGVYKKEASTFNEIKRNCVLTFDEANLSNNIDIDEKYNKVWDHMNPVKWWWHAN